MGALSLTHPPDPCCPLLALGVLEYRVLGTNFRDYAVVFTQLEFGDEAFNTVELYSEWPLSPRGPRPEGPHWLCSAPCSQRPHSHTMSPSGAPPPLPAPVGGGTLPGGSLGPWRAWGRRSTGSLSAL